MKRYFTFGIAITVVLVTFFSPQGNFSHEQIALIGILIAAVLLWSTEVIDSAVTGLLVIAFLVLTNIIPLEKAWGKIGDPIILLLLAVYLVGEGVKSSGFGKRVALKIILLARGKTSRLLLAFMVTTFIFTFFIPTSLGRAAIVLSLAGGLADTGTIKDENLLKSVFIAIPFTSLLGSVSLITGTSGMIYAAKIYSTQLGYNWSYLNWMIAFLPLGLITVLGVWRILLKIFPLKTTDSEDLVKEIDRQSHLMGSMSREETIMLVIIILMVTGWITMNLHGLSVELVALLSILLLFVPGVDLLNWKKVSKKINWGSLLMFTSSLALAEAMLTTGIAVWMGNLLKGIINGHGVWAAVLGINCLMILVRLGLNNVTAALALTLPAIFSLALSTGINPIWLGMVTISSSCMGLILPGQSISITTSFGMGFFSVADLRKAGLAVTIFFIFCIFLVSLIYWPLIGFPPK